MLSGKFIANRQRTIISAPGNDGCIVLSENILTVLYFEYVLYV